MPLTTPNLVAGGTLYPSRFVAMDTNAFKVVAGTANARTLGITQVGTNYPPITDSRITVNAYAAVAGEQVQMFGLGEVCLLEAGAAISVGDRLKSDSSGRGVPIASSGTTIQQIGAIALQEAAGAGEKILVQVLFTSERPALT